MRPQVAEMYLFLDSLRVHCFQIICCHETFDLDTRITKTQFIVRYLLSFLQVYVCTNKRTAASLHHPSKSTCTITRLMRQARQYKAILMPGPSQAQIRRSAQLALHCKVQCVRIIPSNFAGYAVHTSLNTVYLMFRNYCFTAVTYLSLL